MAIADIATQTGFDSSISFISAFKQMTGLTPSKYREQQRQQNAEKQKNAEEEKK
jgi:AraC-like DNA-binding protein